MEGVQTALTFLIETRRRLVPIAEESVPGRTCRNNYDSFPRIPSGDIAASPSIARIVVTTFLFHDSLATESAREISSFSTSPSRDR